jgi:hypothetical protein
MSLELKPIPSALMFHEGTRIATACPQSYLNTRVSLSMGLPETPQLEISFLDVDAALE